MANMRAESLGSCLDLNLGSDNVKCKKDLAN